GLGLELTRTGSGERVKAGAAIVLRLTPRAFDPAAALKTIDGGVEGTLQEFEALAGDLLDAQQDAVAMQRTERDRLEDEHLECALREFNWFRQKLSPIWKRRLYARSPIPSRRLHPGLRKKRRGRASVCALMNSFLL